MLIFLTIKSASKQVKTLEIRFKTKFLESFWIALIWLTNQLAKFWISKIRELGFSEKLTRDSPEIFDSNSLLTNFDWIRSSARSSHPRTQLAVISYSAIRSYPSEETLSNSEDDSVWRKRPSARWLLM